MKIWITGVAGFLGSHLAETLLAQGHYIYGNDNLICGELKNIAWTNLGLRFTDIDCRDHSYLLSEFNDVKPDILIHCAATAHEGLSNFSPSFITKNIYEASISTFSAAIAAGVKRIIFMSSMARYGQQELPFHEDQAPKPVDPYGIAKVAAEDTLKALCKLHDVEYVIAVPHNIIGTRQRYCDPYRNVASIMINRALQGKPIIVYGDGQQKRCFSPIRDCLDSLIKMIDAPISGETINIGPDNGEITVLELAHIICELTDGVDYNDKWKSCDDARQHPVYCSCAKYRESQINKIQFIADRPNEVKEAYCSSTKAKELLGFSSKQNIRECLAEMVYYIRQHGTKEFIYDFPLEIVSDKTPKTWTDRLI